MESFDRWMSDRQKRWRQSNVKTAEEGWQNGKQRAWILPRDSWEEGLWTDIRTGGKYPLAEYLGTTIKKHDGVHNLKSSWAHCANLYFPFGRSAGGRSLLAGFLQANVSATVTSVDAVELEYAADAALHPSVLLGEPGGMRGANQTSPDLGIVVNGGRGLILTENKLVEHSFYPCSGHWYKGAKSRPANPDPSRCDNPLAGLSAESQCHQVTWRRRYWEHLAPFANADELSRLRCCPAARSGYQLFRQQALAEGIAQSGRYDFVVSSVALDDRNDVLQRCLKSTNIADVRDWGTLFDGSAAFKVWDHQQWVTWVEQNDGAGEWMDWLQYVKSRYGYV